MSSIARALHILTETNQKFLWTDEFEGTFKKLKKDLTSTPVLTYPQHDKLLFILNILFILNTVASNESFCAFLSHDIDDQEHVIAYWSKCLSKTVRN